MKTSAQLTINRTLFGRQSRVTHFIKRCNEEKITQNISRLHRVWPCQELAFSLPRDHELWAGNSGTQTSSKDVTVPKILAQPVILW